jgi:hypothetical protein
VASERERRTEFKATTRAHNLMKLGVKELIKLCIYCWGHPLLYTFSGSVAVWMLLSGNLQHPPLLVHQGPAATLSPHSGSLSFSLSLQSQRLPEL